MTMKFLRPEEVPEGYTYTRTDLLTAEEFIEKHHGRKSAQQYVADNPREFYTLDDDLAYGQIRQHESNIERHEKWMHQTELKRRNSAKEFTFSDWEKIKRRWYR